MKPADPNRLHKQPTCTQQPPDRSESWIPSYRRRLVARASLCHLPWPAAVSTTHDSTNGKAKGNRLGKRVDSFVRMGGIGGR